MEFGGPDVRSPRNDWRGVTMCSKEELKPSTGKIERGQWMFEASSVGISRAIGVDVSVSNVQLEGG